MAASRQLSITIPADNNWHNLYTLMLAVPGAVPTDGILSKNVCNLNIYNNSAGTIYIADSNYANNTGDPIVATGNWYKSSSFNNIFIPDYFVQGNALTFSVDTVTA